jgi:hypothetical protein
MAGTLTVKMLAQYKAWADKVIFDGVAALPPGEAEKERKTLFKTIIGTLNHSYVVDLIWQAHLERREHGFKARNILLHSELPAHENLRHQGLQRELAACWHPTEFAKGAIRTSWRAMTPDVALMPSFIALMQRTPTPGCWRPSAFFGATNPAPRPACSRRAHRATGSPP